MNRTGTAAMTSLSEHGAPAYRAGRGSRPSAQFGTAAAANVPDELLRQIGASLLAEMTSETAAGRVLIDALALSPTARLAQRCSAGVSGACVGGLDDIRLKRVVDHIRLHLSEDLGVDELAAVACLSPFHFTRMFRKSTGMPPHRYVAELRLARAKSLLLLSDQSLVEIALETCFSSQSNFTRAFRQATGMTPGEYRRAAR
jgi:AraC family transcriptional regulator